MDTENFGDQELAREIEALHPISIVRQLRQQAALLDTLTGKLCTANYVTRTHMSLAAESKGRATAMADMIESYVQEFSDSAIGDDDGG